MNTREAILREFARASVFLLVVFAVVFYGADFIAGERSQRLKVDFEWESAIPFHPAAYAVYFSVFLLPFLLPFVVREVREIRRWRTRSAIAIAIAGLVFVLAPAELGYPPRGGGWLSELAAIVCGRYNLLPSLHVALTLVIIGSLWPDLARRGRWRVALWGAALALSTLLTHQHHVLDVAAGLLLGAFVCSLKLRAS